jgi:hypothetical protein
MQVLGTMFDVCLARFEGVRAKGAATAVMSLSHLPNDKGLIRQGKMSHFMEVPQSAARSPLSSIKKPECDYSAKEWTMQKDVLY